jgi:SAM-dependent methyltransferase
VYQFLVAGKLDRARPFLSQYRAVRRADGHQVMSADRYTVLPLVPSDDPHAGEWRIRRESFATAVARAALRSQFARRILDVGAGNGWLSYQLSQLGHAPVALDLDDDAGDGLRAVSAHKPFPLVQADFDAMPFARGQFDLVVMNASLHYSPDPERTLRAAERLLVDGGSLVVMDSPMFDSVADGEAMVAEQLQRLRSEFAIPKPVRPGVGFLTFDGLQRFAEGIGRSTRFFASHGSIAWRLRRAWSSRRLGRPAASFGVWVAQ